MMMILNKIKKIIDENPDNIAYIVNDECITCSGAVAVTVPMMILVLVRKLSLSL